MRDDAMAEISTGPKMSVRPATEADAVAIAEIHNQGIEDRAATCETELRSPEDLCTRLRSIAGRYPALVAETEGQVVGWASERLGLWKLLSRIFLFNEASRALCRKHGFRKVGVYERHEQLDGRWLDVVIVERLIPANLA
jgi:L-amino acid N-acyltransferase YncA